MPRVLSAGVLCGDGAPCLASSRLSRGCPLRWRGLVGFLPGLAGFVCPGIRRPVWVGSHLAYRPFRRWFRSDLRFRLSTSLIMYVTPCDIASPAKSFLTWPSTYRYGGFWPDGLVIGFWWRGDRVGALRSTTRALSAGCARAAPGSSLSRNVTSAGWALLSPRCASDAQDVPRSSCQVFAFRKFDADVMRLT